MPSFFLSEDSGKKKIHFNEEELLNLKHNVITHVHQSFLKSIRFYLKEYLKCAICLLGLGFSKNLSLEDGYYEGFHAQNVNATASTLTLREIYSSLGEVSVNILWNFPRNHGITCLQRGKH